MSHYSPEKLMASMIKKPPRSQKFQKQQKIHTYTIPKDVADERAVPQGKTGNCPVCEKDLHDIEDCPTFLTQPVQDRKQETLL